MDLEINDTFAYTKLLQLVIIRQPLNRRYITSISCKGAITMQAQHLVEEVVTDHHSHSYPQWLAL